MRHNEDILSERELDILLMLEKGLNLAEIAALLSISINTVKTHVKRIYQKLAVNSRTQALYEAGCMGLLRPTPVMTELTRSSAADVE